MKHYAPKSGLYIKVAKLRTGVGSAEMSHLQNCSLKIYLKSTGQGWRDGGRGGGGGTGNQGRCEQRSEVFFVNFFFFFFGGGGGGGHRVDVNKELKFL